MTIPVWVVGAGGLLGSAIARTARARGWDVLSMPSVRWGTPHALGDLRSARDRFTARAAGGPWRLMWCAGRGVPSTPDRDLIAETERFESFFAEDVRLAVGSGVVAYASSAGAVWSSTGARIVDEETTEAPINEYGRQKLRQEEALRAWSARTGHRVVIGRITNLYGPGQDLSKPQGLVSKVCLAALAGVPLSFATSTDTQRDLIYVDDAARLLASATDAMLAQDRLTQLKVIANGSPVTISALWRTVRALRRTATPATFPAGRDSPSDGHMLFRSVRLTEADDGNRVGLVEGIHRTMLSVEETVRRDGRPQARTA